VKLIVGLGNPGAQYAATRHNIGFRVVHRIAQQHGVTLTTRRAEALVGQGVIEGSPMLLVLPQTFMNRSGLSVRQLCEALRIGVGELLVVCDDVHLSLGTVRMRENGSAGGHNGLQSVIDATGSDRFARLRIGVGEPPEGQPMKEYVLEPMSAAEHDMAAQSIEESAQACRTWVLEGAEAVMNRWNAKRVD